MMTSIQPILLVTEDAACRESFTRALRAEGWQVLHSKPGRPAVQALQANNLGLIVLHFGVSNTAGEPVATLEALTDFDPLLPVLLVCDRRDVINYRTALMADMVMRTPVRGEELAEAAYTLLSETLRERMHRKSADLAALA